MNIKKHNKMLIKVRETKIKDIFLSRIKRKIKYRIKERVLTKVWTN